MVRRGARRVSRMAHLRASSCSPGLLRLVAARNHPICRNQTRRLTYPMRPCYSPKPSQPLPAFHHLPFVREAAAALSSSPDDFSLLRTYFDTHRSSSLTTPNAAPASSSSIATPPKALQLLGSPSLVLPATELALLSVRRP